MFSVNDKERPPILNSVFCHSIISSRQTEYQSKSSWSGSKTATSGGSSNFSRISDFSGKDSQVGQLVCDEEEERLAADEARGPRHHPVGHGHDRGHRSHRPFLVDLKEGLLEDVADEE